MEFALVWLFVHGLRMLPRGAARVVGAGIGWGINAHYNASPMPDRVEHASIGVALGASVGTVIAIDAWGAYHNHQFKQYQRKDDEK